MELVAVSFAAGVLTVLAPCILPLLPVIIGGAAGQQRQPLTPFIISGSLAVSIFVFTLLLRASTSLLHIPLQVWQIISGLLIVLLGATLFAPALWEKHSATLNARAGKLLGQAGHQKGIWRSIATGAALGPVFSSCSPTYAFILAVLLPRSWPEGLANLAAYTLGLSMVLLLLAYFGQQLVGRLAWASDPHGWLKRGIGILFIIVGISIIFGLDKDLQAFIITNGWYAPVEQFENGLR